MSESVNQSNLLIEMSSSEKSTSPIPKKKNIPKQLKSSSKTSKKPPVVSEKKSTNSNIRIFSDEELIPIRFKVFDKWLKKDLKAESYPTKWNYGIPYGTVKENLSEKYFILSIKSKGNKIRKFKLSDYESREACLFDIIKTQYKLCNELGIIRNYVRFINPSTIEVKINESFIFKMDAIFMDKINTYPLQAVSKKLKGTSNMYIYQQCIKKRHL